MRTHLATLASDEQRLFFVEHAYAFDGVVNDIRDDGLYWNHSESPNTGCGSNKHNSFVAADDDDYYQKGGRGVLLQMPCGDGDHHHHGDEL